MLKNRTILQEDPLLKPLQAAEYLGMSYPWLKAQGDELGLPYVRYGSKAKLYRKSDLDAFIKKHIKGVAVA